MYSVSLALPDDYRAPVSEPLVAVPLVVLPHSTASSPVLDACVLALFICAMGLRMATLKQHVGFTSAKHIA